MTCLIPFRNRRHFGLAALTQLRHDAVDDHLRADREPAVVKDGPQPRLLDRCLEREQRPKLRVAVLLDHEYGAVRGEERLDVLPEWEGADAHVVNLDTTPREGVHRLACR